MIPKNETSSSSPQYSFDESGGAGAGAGGKTTQKKSSPPLLLIKKPKRCSSPPSLTSDRSLEGDTQSTGESSASADEEITEIVRFLKDLDKKEKAIRKQQLREARRSSNRSTDMHSLNYSEGSTEGSPTANESRLDGSTLLGNMVCEQSTCSGESWTTGTDSRSDSHSSSTNTGNTATKNYHKQVLASILGEPDSEEECDRDDSQYDAVVVTPSPSRKKTYSRPSTAPTTTTMDNENFLKNLAATQESSSESVNSRTSGNSGEEAAEAAAAHTATTTASATATTTATTAAKSIATLEPRTSYTSFNRSASNGSAETPPSASIAAAATAAGRKSSKFIDTIRPAHKAEKMRESSRRNKKKTKTTLKKAAIAAAPIVVETKSEDEDLSCGGVEETKYEPSAVIDTEYGEFMEAPDDEKDANNNNNNNKSYYSRYMCGLDLADWKDVTKIRDALCL
ncbi:MAG: hypothetical protein SGBAC_007507 [Bacillariaceae sp.]